MSLTASSHTKLTLALYLFLDKACYFQLANRGVTHGGVQPEWCGSALGMRIVSLPTPDGACPKAANALRSRLLAATLRLTTKNQARVWTAEIVFHGSPVRTPNPKEQGGLCVL